MTKLVVLETVFDVKKSRAEQKKVRVKLAIHLFELDPAGIDLMFFHQAMQAWVARPQLLAEAAESS